MTWFDDAVEQAMPYLTTEEIAGTQGASWQWTYTFDDSAADLSSGYTATCVIKRDIADVSSVASVSVTFPAANQVRCTVTPSTTATVPEGRYLHEVEIARTSDSRRLKVVGSGDSLFHVLPGTLTPTPGVTTGVGSDTDSVPYYDVAASGQSVLTDTDGAWYVASSGTSLPVLTDTDGAPYVAV